MANSPPVICEDDATRFHSKSEKKPTEKDELEVRVDLEKFKHMFIVMDLRPINCKQLLNTVPQTELGEDEIICILYN